MIERLWYLFTSQLFESCISSLLQRVFQQNRHEDVLDLTVVQFEPDSADYIRVSGNKIC